MSALTARRKECATTVASAIRSRRPATRIVSFVVACCAVRPFRRRTDDLSTIEAWRAIVIPRAENGRRVVVGTARGVSVSASVESVRGVAVMDAARGRQTLQLAILALPGPRRGVVDTHATVDQVRRAATRRTDLGELRDGRHVSPARCSSRCSSGARRSGTSRRGRRRCTRAGSGCTPRPASTQTTRRPGSSERDILNGVAGVSSKNNPQCPNRSNRYTDSPNRVRPTATTVTVGRHI